MIELPADEAAAITAEEMRADPNWASAVCAAQQASEGKSPHGADVLQFRRPPAAAPQQGPNGAAYAQPTAADRSPAASSHRQQAFDDIVQENLRRGLLMTQRDVLINAVRDPRLSQRHRLTLASLIEHTNAKSGMAYPGWRALAETTTWYDHEWVERHYTQSGIGKTISELIDFGFLAAIRRAPGGHGRALSHYTIVKPSIDELQQQITAYIMEMREGRGPKVDPTPERSLRKGDPTPGHKVSDRTYGGKVSAPDPSPQGRSSRADPTPVVPTGTSREGTSKGSADAPPPMTIAEQAVAIFNMAAGKHGFLPCHTLSDARRKRLDKRLEDIGGIDAFKLALSVIHRNEFLMGRVAPKSGKARFKLDLNCLLRTDSKLDDVLAQLLDIAREEGQHVGQPETEDERRDRITMGDERYARYRAMKAAQNTEDGGHA